VAAVLGCLFASSCSAAHRQPARTMRTGQRQKLFRAASRSVPVFALTGRRAPDARAARRPSLAVKIDNVYGAWPQAGLNQADIVFDALVEGGLTRLMAVYQSHNAPLVGPIRSARPVDAYLLRLFHGGYFAFSGASPGEMRPVRAFSHAVLSDDVTDPAAYYRRADHQAPDNLFSSTRRLYSTLHRRAPHEPPPPPVFDHAVQTPTGVPTRSVRVPYPGATAGWTWDGRSYLRTQDGPPDVLIGGQRVRTTNVIVMSVRTVGTGIFETNGAEDPLPVVVGSGPCWVMRNGVRVRGSWRHTKLGPPMQVLDTHGRAIPLAPGPTWVELMPRSGLPQFHS
jgi:Protein of unknown function (DUF3048) N-terminal domain/Protein of unknown function (DUF3048) C-terminal domain